MTEARPPRTGLRQPRTGLRTGLVILVVVALAGLVSGLRPGPLAVVKADRSAARPEPLEARLDDPATAAYLAKLAQVSPGTLKSLEGEGARLILDGAENEALSRLVLQSLLLELRAGAGAFKTAPTLQFDRIIDHVETGLRRLEGERSVWCKGPRLAAYLGQDEMDLLPALIALYPYQSESYNWAMGFGVLYLEAVAAGRGAPVRRAAPGAYEKAVLQRTGLRLGSDQWALGLQIMVFSQSEGQGYAQMQAAISGINACQLGLAAAQVSDAMPPTIRATIWADLLPELFQGNMPYVLWRVNDYFFLE